MTDIANNQTVPATELKVDDLVLLFGVPCRVARAYDMRVYVSVDIESMDRSITADIRVQPGVRFEVFKPVPA